MVTMGVNVDINDFVGICVARGPRTAAKLLGRLLVGVSAEEKERIYLATMLRHIDPPLLDKLMDAIWQTRGENLEGGSS